MQELFATRDEWEIHNKSPILKYARLCLKAKIYTINEVINYLIKLPTTAPSQYFLSVCFFAPETFKANQGIFTTFKQIIQKMVVSEDQTATVTQVPGGGGPLYRIKDPVVQEYVNCFDILCENDFQKLIPLIDTGCEYNSVELDIYNDDVENMSSKMGKTYNTNRKVSPNPFHPAMFLQWRPTLLEMAAFYGSPKSFDYLLKRNARTSFIAMMAVAGGFESILKRVEELKEPFEACLRIAAAFRDIKTIEWLIQNHFSELKYDKEINYVLARAAFTNYLPMLDFCINKGVDINFSDENGETALHLAVKMENKEALLFLISRPHLQFRKKNVYGLNPHSMTKNKEILDILNGAEEKRAQEKEKQKKAKRI